MRKIVLCLLLLSSLLCGIIGAGVPWTWTYSKKLYDNDRTYIPSTLYMCGEDFGHNPKNSFSQLVFSWNAVRPKEGFFRFSVRVQYRTTRTWSPWYSMMEWGAGVQRSFVKKGIDMQSEYLYVRLEMLKGVTANDFQIKIEAVDGTDMRSLILATVCISNFKAFAPEDGSLYAKLSSVCIAGVPVRSQMLLDHPRNTVLCSPTSLSMVVHYLSDQNLDPCDFAEGAFDEGLGIYGSWPFNIAHAYERCGGNVLFKLSRLATFRQLYHYLGQNIPVVVSVRGELCGAPQAYPNGHLLVVIGYDSKNAQVICHDPAHQTERNVVIRYGLNDFLSAWERSHRLAYVAQWT